jgi:hypothetical protein
MKKFFRNHRWIAEIFAVMIVLLIATVVLAGEFWIQKNARFSGTAGETLATGDVVCIGATDGKIYKAIASDATKRPAIGVINKGGAALSIVEVITNGILAGQTSATPGARLYLSATAGTITTTAPTNAQPLGFVMPGVIGIYHI